MLIGKHSSLASLKHFYFTAVYNLEENLSQKNILLHF